MTRRNNGSKSSVCPTLHTVVLPCKLLYEFLVLIKLLQVVTGHSIGAMVLGAVDVMLVTKDTVERKHRQKQRRGGRVRSQYAPDADVGPWYAWKSNCPRAASVIRPQ